MASARREYLALLEADAQKGKAGRPRKKIPPPADTAEGDPFDEPSQ